MVSKDPSPTKDDAVIIPLVLIFAVELNEDAVVEIPEEVEYPEITA